MSVKVEYRTNNSGGSWWLSDDDWKALEDAGWEVEWGGVYHCGTSASFRRPEGAPEPCESSDDCPGHSVCENAEQARAHRWLGALATRAEIEVEDPVEAIRSFERVTGEDASAEGCNCCGPPHSFSWEDENGEWEYASGDSVLSLLYEDVPASMREATERLNR